MSAKWSANHPPADVKSIETINEALLHKLREVAELLTFLRDSEGPDAYMDYMDQLGVAKGLSPDHHLKLSALVAGFYAEGNCVKWLEPQKRERRLWAREGLRRIKKLRVKMHQARTAVNAVRDYLTKIDVPIGAHIRDTFSRAASALDSAGLAQAETLIDSMKRTEPAEDAMVTLYDFFVSDCRLKKNEAEVRVGKIGNQLWDWNVDITERYPGEGENWKGCPAVRKAVARRDRARDASRKFS
jgi:hypothetical protein